MDAIKETCGRADNQASTVFPKNTKAVSFISVLILFVISFTIALVVGIC